MPTSQYVRHALHCDFGSTSTISQSSVFPAALIKSFDSLLKGSNARCCWRSLWSAFRWAWFSIFWIKLWTLMPCDRFTIAFRHAWDVELDVRENQLLVCVLDSTGFPVLSWTCMTRLSSHFTGFTVLSEEPSSSCKHLPTISCEQDCVFSLHGFPRSITDWIGFGLGWFGRAWHVVLLQKTVERAFQLADVQL